MVTGMFQNPREKKSCRRLLNFILKFQDDKNLIEMCFFLGMNFIIRYRKSMPVKVNVILLKLHDILMSGNKIN